MEWIDLWLPTGTVGVPDDVRGSMMWAGERWLAALPDRPAGADRTLHRGGLVSSAWADLVCFAGVGPGEVLVDGRKLVGLSQRRTRHGARIQGVVYRHPPRVDDHGVFDVDVPPGRPPRPAVERRLDRGRLVERLASPARAIGIV
jgi:hypothetical protein